MPVTIGFPREIASAVSDPEAIRLHELAEGKVFLELGSHYGFSTIVLARAAKELHSIDWHKGDSMAGHGDNLLAFRENLRRFGVEDSVIAHVGRFEDVLQIFKTGYFDGAFIDGEHDEASVRRDAELVLRCVKKGGSVAFHDYGRFEVAPVVDGIAKVLGSKVEVVDHLAIVSK